MDTHIGSSPFSYGPIPGRSEGKKGVKTPTPQEAFEKENKEVCAEVIRAKTEEAIGTSGGHGGFRTATVTLNDTTEHHVFLKKYDPVEHSNYEVFQDLLPETGSLRDFMARCYGKVTIGNQEYLVLENLSIGSTQVADVKLSKGGIVSSKELQATGRKKSKITRLRQMVEGEAAPGIMVAKEGPRALRTFNYPRSISLLQEALFSAKPTPPTPEQLRNLNAQLEKLQNSLTQSPGGVIGASLFMYRDNVSGDFTVFIGDPAHVIFDNATAVSKSDRTTLYTGSNREVSERISANRESIELIRIEISQKIASMETTSTDNVASKRLSDTGIDTAPSARKRKFSKRDTTEKLSRVAKRMRSQYL